MSIQPDAYLHVNRERPDMRGVSLSHDESGYNTSYDTFPLYRHPAPGWQPIETAPDREYILILVDGQITGVGSTYLGDWWASMPNGEVCELNEPPTHWMPLPEVPE